MTIDCKKNGTELTIALDGRLDSTTALQLNDAIEAEIGGVTRLVFDFADLDYLSSAGLRVLLNAQKTMNRQGEMVFLHVGEAVRDFFALTGLLDIFTILS